MRRPRVAPMDSRVASSFERAAARASSRLATFTQAMSSTSAVTASSSVSGGRRVRRETALAARPGIETDTPRLELRHHLIAHALLERHLDLVEDGAIGRVDRGARLFHGDAWLQTCEQVDPVSAPILGWAARIGRQPPAHRDRHEDLRLQPDASCRSNPCGATPTMVMGCPLTTIVSSRTSGRPPSWLCQYA